MSSDVQKNTTLIKIRIIKYLRFPIFRLDRIKLREKRENKEKLKICEEKV